MAVSFDGNSRLIALDGATTVSIRGIYSRWVEWVNGGDNAKFLPAFSTIANPPRVPVYATLENGWKLKPFNSGSVYDLTLEDGFLLTADESDPFAPSDGVEPRVRYRDPVIAVGFAIDGAGGGSTGLTDDDRAKLTEARNFALAANLQTQRETP